MSFRSVHSTKEGSITPYRQFTSLQATLLTWCSLQPFYALDATTVLFVLVTEFGIYPAVDPLASSALLLIHPLLVRMAVRRPPAGVPDLQGHHCNSGRLRAAAYCCRASLQQFLSAHSTLPRSSLVTLVCTTPLRLSARLQRLLTVSAMTFLGRHSVLQAPSKIPRERAAKDKSRFG